MRKLLMVMGVICIAKASFAADIVKDAVITKVGSTISNQRAFYVQVEGGTGTCANTSITFPEEYAQSVINYALSHGLAVQAYTYKKKVRIHNYGDKVFSGGNVCSGASFIEIYD